MYGRSAYHDFDKSIYRSIVWSRTRAGRNVSCDPQYITCAISGYRREKANLAITLTKGADTAEIVAHGALYDYPNLSTVNCDQWEHWLAKNYDVSMATV